MGGIGGWVGVVNGMELCALEVVFNATCEEDCGDVFAEFLD